MKILLGLLTLAVCHSTFAHHADSVPGEYLVQLKENTSIESFNKTLGLNPLEINYVHKKSNVIKMKLEAGIFHNDSVLKRLKANENILIAEPNYIYKLNEVNDPEFSKQWGIESSKGNDIDLLAAWQKQTGSADTIIAVIDTGVDYNHEDLKNNLWVNEAEANGEEGVDDDGNGYIDDIYGYDFKNDDADPMDDHGHGSHCAGVIAAESNNGLGIVGINQKASIMILKFLAADGGTTEGAIKSIDYATMMGAHISNNSWGGGGKSELLEASIQRARDAGSLFVAAAGNSGRNTDSSPAFPASYETENIISVAAINSNGELASFSNYGATTVDVAAPGVNVYSSVQNDKYRNMSGTSMAAPHVAGIAGLIKSDQPGFGFQEIKDRILNFTLNKFNLKSSVMMGGIANANFALNEIESPLDPRDPARLTEEMALDIRTDHPYAADESLEFEVKVEGAEEISINFSKFKTERGYDKVRISDFSSQKIYATYSGNLGEFQTEIIPSNHVKILFTSDGSKEDFGFEIDHVNYN